MSPSSVGPCERWGMLLDGGHLPVLASVLKEDASRAPVEASAVASSEDPSATPESIFGTPGTTSGRKQRFMRMTLEGQLPPVPGVPPAPDAPPAPLTPAPEDRATPSWTAFAPGGVPPP